MASWWAGDQMWAEPLLKDKTKLSNWLNTNACVYLPLYKRFQLSLLCAIFLMMHGLHRPQIDLCLQTCAILPKTKQTTARQLRKAQF